MKTVFAALALVAAPAFAQIGPNVAPDGTYQPRIYQLPQNQNPISGPLMPYTPQAQPQQRLPNPNDYMPPPQQPQVIRIQPMPQPNPFPQLRPAF